METQLCPLFSNALSLYEYCTPPYPAELDDLWGGETHHNWACRLNARHSSRAGTGKARNSRCRARAHRGLTQAQHTRSHECDIYKDKHADKRAKRGKVRVGRCKARTHKRDTHRIQCNTPAIQFSSVSVHSHLSFRSPGSTDLLNLPLKWIKWQLILLSAYTIDGGIVRTPLTNSLWFFFFGLLNPHSSRV